MRGLKLSVNFATGQRAGGLDPRDGRTRCNPRWQGEDTEVRVVLDESILDELDTSDPGVEVLDSDAQIDRAVAGLGDGDYAIADTQLALEHLRQKGRSLDEYVDSNGDALQGSALARALHEAGVTGINAPPPRPSVADVAGGPRRGR